jgi:hypothetical protein
VRADRREAARARADRDGGAVNPQVRRASVVFVAMLGFALLSWAIFRGYLTPEMMVYFLSFQWCF